MHLKTKYGRANKENLITSLPNSQTEITLLQTSTKSRYSKGDQWKICACSQHLSPPSMWPGYGGAGQSKGGVFYLPAFLRPVMVLALSIACCTLSCEGQPFPNSTYFQVWHTHTYQFSLHEVNLWVLSLSSQIDWSRRKRRRRRREIGQQIYFRLWVTDESTYSHLIFTKKHPRLIIGMSDVQNFFHEALAVIIAKLQYLYTRRKLSVSSIKRYHFPVERSMCA